ncbi:MAG: MarR family transcriptional regulator [Sulfurospirillaceae bacterium]|nr:MarR family transcriptional regulator [Sulfurospirillaceae bacterium]
MKIKTDKTYGDFADSAMRTWIQIFRAFNKIRAKETLYIQSFGLTINQFQVLEVLYHRGDLNVGAITKLTMSTPGNITVVIKNLKRDGYIVSIPDEHDKRASILSITPKGKEVIEQLFPGHAKNFESYFKMFDENEMETLYTLARKLHKSQ